MAERARKVGSAFQVSGPANGSQYDSVTVGLLNGNFVVTWTDESSSGDDYSNVRAQIFSASGARIGSEFEVNTTVFRSQDSPDITVLTNGNFVVSWQDDSGQGGTDKAQIFTASGDKVGSEFSVEGASSIAGMAGGGFVVSRTGGSGEGEDTKSSVKAQIYSASGAEVGAELLVAAETAGFKFNPDIAALANGGFVVNWVDIPFAGVGHHGAPRRQLRG